ncbi:MAG: dihydropteroate synthase [Planctomycetota bacterium]
MTPSLASRFRDVKIAGIVNVTRDSFSDGGRYFAPEDAIAHARFLMEDGADLIDLGPASSHPKAESVPAEEEIRRLTEVADALLADGIPLSVDSPLGETQLWAAARGFAQINDIRGLPDPEVNRRLADYDCDLVVMHSIQRGVRADIQEKDPAQVVAGVHDYFETRIQELTDAGIARDRLILDPGMGYFLGDGPPPSIAMLQDLPRLHRHFELPLYVSVTRKSFLGKLTGRPTERRGAATLAAEIYAVAQGTNWIRTHDAGALKDACRVQAVLQ